MLRRGFLAAAGAVAASASTAKGGGVRTELKFGDKVRVTMSHRNKLAAMADLKASHDRWESYEIPLVVEPEDWCVVGFVTFIEDASHLMVQSRYRGGHHIFEFHRRITDNYERRRWYIGGKNEREVQVEILDD